MNQSIRSSKLKLTFANKTKLSQLMSLVSDDISQQISSLSNHLLTLDKIPALLPKDITESIPQQSSWVRQLIGKEASANARSIKNKLKRIKPGTNQKYQQELLNKYQSNTLNIVWKGNIQLDSRFISIEPSKDSIFDYWLNLQWKGVKRFYIPIKLNKHHKDLFNRGYSLKHDTIKVCNNGNIILLFKKDIVGHNGYDKSIGIDIGRNKSFYTSDNETESLTKDILNSLKTKKHGSKNKAKCVHKLKQTIDYLIKHNINWNISRIILENITGMKYANKWGNINHHWSYSYIQNRICLRAEELDVLIHRIHPAYTSQTCSGCGYIHKDNRKGEVFECISCGMEMDADYNASINIHMKGINSTHYPKNNNLSNKDELL